MSSFNNSDIYDTYQSQFHKAHNKLFNDLKLGVNMCKYCLHVSNTHYMVLHWVQYLVHSFCYYTCLL